MRRFTRQIAAGTAALVILAGSLLLLSYARWVRSIADGDRALENREFAVADSAYATAVAQSRRMLLPSALLRSRYRTLVFNRARLLDARGNYDALGHWLEEIATRTTAFVGDPEYHYWAGVVEYRRAIAQNDKQALRTGLQRACEEFRLALSIAPDDWDAKYNFELTARLLDRMQNKKGETQQKQNRGGMKILREDTDKPKEQPQKLAPEKQS